MSDLRRGDGAAARDDGVAVQQEATMTEALDAPKVTNWFWTPAREKAAFAMGHHPKQSDAAKEAGVAHESISRWMQHPEFRQRVEDHRAATLGDARGALQAVSFEAVNVVIDNMRFGNVRTTTRLAAAKDILDRVGLKAPEKHEYSGPEGQPLPPAIQVVALDYRTAVAALTAGSDDDYTSSGEGESIVDGTSVGQERDGRRD